MAQTFLGGAFALEGERWTMGKKFIVRQESASMPGHILVSVVEVEIMLDGTPGQQISVRQASQISKALKWQYAAYRAECLALAAHLNSQL